MLCLRRLLSFPPILGQLSCNKTTAISLLLQQQQQQLLIQTEQQLPSATNVVVARCCHYYFGCLNKTLIIVDNRNNFCNNTSKLSRHAMITRPGVPPRVSPLRYAITCVKEVVCFPLLTVTTLHQLIIIDTIGWQLVAKSYLPSFKANLSIQTLAGCQPSVGQLSAICGPVVSQLSAGY